MDTTHKNVEYLGRIHPNEVMELNKRSKMTLNAINYYHESHERVFGAMATGAVNLTSTSPFYEESFSSEEGVFFKWSDENLGAHVQSLLEDDPSLEKMANAGHQAFLKGHKWKHRALHVLDQVGINQ